jgi:hypothetical protein
MSDDLTARVAREWRAERDKREPIKSWPQPRRGLNCETCAPGPCRFPTFCAAVEETASNDRTFGGRLPDKWWEMTEAQLGRWLDNWREREGRVAEATFWAIHYAISREGFEALKRRKADLAQMSAEQLKRLADALEKTDAGAIIDELRELA